MTRTMKGRKKVKLTWSQMKKNKTYATRYGYQLWNMSKMTL